MTFGDGSGEPRDSSAAAITVCGILEAVKYMQGEEREKYLAYANKMMASLIDDYLCWGVDYCNGLLLHATYSVPHNGGVDECNIRGDYFFAKTLDKVRPGGVVAFITSNGTMDKKNSNVRKYIAQRADLIGAIRLPDNTFKADAETGQGFAEAERAARRLLCKVAAHRLFSHGNAQRYSGGFGK